MPLSNAQYNNRSNKVKFSGRPGVFEPGENKSEYYFKTLDYDSLSDSQECCQQCLPVFTKVKNVDAAVYKALPEKEKELLRYWTSKDVSVIEAVKAAIKLAKSVKETKDLKNISILETDDPCKITITAKNT